MVLARAAQFKLAEQDRERDREAKVQTSKRARSGRAAKTAKAADAEAEVDESALMELDAAVKRAWELVALTEDMERVDDPMLALPLAQRASAKWTRAEAALMQHPFLAQLLKQTAHRAADDAEGVAVASCSAFLGLSLDEVPVGIRRAMVLLRSATDGSVTLGALHPLAQLEPWIACAVDRDPVARALLWRVAICALPLLRLSPVQAPRALGAAMGALGAAAYSVTTPAQGVRICYLNIFSGCHNVVWTLRFGRSACDERLKRLKSKEQE